ncbi:hypothetical protein [Roseiconus lacunae]|nr:hypothetical protein [Roseiconus lacunae]
MKRMFHGAAEALFVPVLRQQLNLERRLDFATASEQWQGRMPVGW